MLINHELKTKLANLSNSFSLVSCCDPSNQEIWYLTDLITLVKYKINPKDYTDIQAKFYIFDLKSHYKKFGWIYNPIPFDLMLASFLENNLNSFDLKSIIDRILNLDFTPKPTEEDALGLDANDLGQDEYYSDLSSILAKVSNYFIQNLSESIYTLCNNIESPLAITLSEMEDFGVYIDQSKLLEISTELKTQSEELGDRITQTIGSSININSPLQLSQALIQAGFNLKSQSNGKISIDKEALEEIEPSDKTGVIKDILDYRTVSKLDSTYAENFLGKLDENSRIHTKFNQVQAPTGRLSSNHPNLQNIPIKHPKFGKLLRSCFSSPNGRVLVGADYSQMELRLLAHFTDDEKLVEAFKNNEDIHTRTAAEIFEIPLEQITPEQRRMGKTLNFALIYQQGAFSTSKQLGISQKEAKSFIEKYFTKFNKVKPFIEETLNLARKNGYVETFYGRRRYFKNLNSNNFQLRSLDERAAFNAVLQGSNADLIKDAMLGINKSITKNNLNAEIILQIHDELILECDESVAQPILDILTTQMCLNQPLKVPILVESNIGKNWALLK